jgi:hypothetical protein
VSDPEDQPELDDFIMVRNPYGEMVIIDALNNRLIKVPVQILTDFIEKLTKS